MYDGLTARIENLAVAESIPRNGSERLIARLIETEGVTSAAVNGKNVKVEFYPQFVTVGYLKEQIEKQGYRTVEPEVKKKGFFVRFIDKLIASNEKAYGSEPLDCCTLKKD